MGRYCCHVSVAASFLVSRPHADRSTKVCRTRGNQQDGQDSHRQEPACPVFVRADHRSVHSDGHLAGGVLSSCPSVPRGPEDTKPWLGGVAALCTPRWHAFSKQGDEAGEEATSSVCRRQPGSPSCKGAHVFSSGFQGVRAYRETFNQIVLFGAKSPHYCLFSKAAAERWVPASCQFTLRCPEVSFFFQTL